MTSYLLPCTCGVRTPVTASQAGQSVRCACGAQVEVPTLRGLELLPRGESAPAPRAIAWDDHHRVAFLMLVLALAAWGIAGYLTMNLPNKLPPISRQDIDEQIEQGSVEMILGLLRSAEKGIGYVSLETALVDGQAVETRQMMLWGIGIAVALGSSGLVAAAIAWLKPQKRAG